MSTNNPTTTTQIAIQKELKVLPAFQRLSSNITRQFAVNLSLVAHGIRSGYLLDLFMLQDPVHLFSRLLSALRSVSQQHFIPFHPTEKTETKYLFGHVVHIYEPASEQSFFINATLLAERMEEVIRPPADPVSDSKARNRLTQKYPVFIYLGSSIKQLDGVPAGILHLLEAFRELNASATPTAMSSNNTGSDNTPDAADGLPLSLSLTEGVDMPDTVALAAVLLDYAVAYVPSREHVNVLAGIPLDFYECVLKIPDSGTTKQAEGKPIAFAKFSCPSEMQSQGAGGDETFSPENIVTWLTEFFKSRLRRGVCQDAQVEVIHTVHILDHVTF